MDSIKKKKKKLKSILDQCQKKEKEAEIYT